MNQAEQETRSEWQDSLLTQLRLAMQGSLLPCLPPNLTTRAAQRRAIRIAAERLTFCYATANPTANTRELSVCRSRLYAVLTYLRYECNPEDCTYDSVVKMLSLDYDTLRNMLAMARHTPRRTQRHYQWATNDPQALGGDIEAMVRLRLQQADELPTEALSTRAVEAALDAAFRVKCPS